jgi:CheY-like chemotaxis protein
MVKRSFEDHRVANQIVHVTDGEMALDYLLRRGQYADPESSPRPHVVLLDLRLPKIDGLQVLKEIRSAEEISRILVVILSTSAAETDVARAYEYHANSYLVKPVDFMKFTEMMDDLGFYWLGWNYFPWGDSR